MGRARKDSEAVASNADCNPDHCPCDDGACALSRYVRATSDASGDAQVLLETERQVSERLAGLAIDMDAMAAVSNVYRAANAVRNHLERTVLAPHELTWTGWVVLWVVWIWGDAETRIVASEAGISKGTLTGVMTTLETRGLVKRRTHPEDARRVLLGLTPKGKKLMATLFPLFNNEEAFVVNGLSATETSALARSLRKVVMAAEG